MSDEKKQVTAQDIKIEGSPYLESLKALMGNEIKDIHGYLTDSEFGFIVFKISKIVLADGRLLGIGGEHDTAFVYNEELIKHLGEDELNRIYCEGNDCEDDSEESED